MSRASSHEIHCWPQLPDLTLCNIKMSGKTGLETMVVGKNMINGRHGDNYVTSKVGVGSTVRL